MQIFHLIVNIHMSHAAVTPSWKAVPYKIHARKFCSWMWLLRGNYGAYVAIMGSTWLLQSHTWSYVDAIYLFLSDDIQGLVVP